MSDVQCHIAAPHGAHDWTPAVQDPSNRQVLHIGLATVHCQGVAAAVELSAGDLCRRAVAVLRDGDLILGDAEIDYAVADMLEVLAELHDQTGINLNGLPEVANVARLIVGDVCRACGCSEYRACPGGCSWAEPNLCSACAKPATAVPEADRG